MLRWVRGWLRLRLTGASPERCLSRFAAEDIAFWDVEREDTLHFTCSVYKSSLAKAQNAALRTLCAAEPLSRHGAAQTFYGLKRRGALLVGLTLAVALALFLQSFVWVVRVEGAETLPQELILRALEEEGVRFGAWGAGLETQSLKNRLLSRLPQLQWISVHAEGCVATVLVSERRPEPRKIDRSLVTNVVAARAGLITSVQVLSGFPAVEAGDAVRQGQLLVSGLADWNVRTQATRALAEVYAQTLRRLELRIPEICGEKRFTGRVGTQIFLILGRKRIKISDNSSNLGSTCDKISVRKRLTLPGGYTFPAELELVALKEYELRRVPLAQTDAAALLSAFAQRQALSDMIAGRILDQRFQIQRRDAGYTAQAELSCEELISVTVPVPLFGEEESNGEADQRRTD